jgi:nucleoside-diphosphate-sugar epimerase
MPRVLITGGAGNMARLVAAELAPRGHELVLFDRHHPRDAPYPWEPAWPTEVGELCDPAAVDRAFAAARPEMVVHLGGNPTPSDHPTYQAGGVYSHYGQVAHDDTFKSNVLGTYYVLDRAARAGVRRVVAASSFFALGIGNRISGAPWRPTYLPIDEAHPTEPEDSYSLSKLLNEEMYRAYARAYGMAVVAMRFLGVYYRHSPEPPGRRFRDRAAAPARRDSVESVWMYVDGRDAAQAVRRGLEADGLDPFEAFFIASGRSIRESPKEAFRREYPSLAHLAEGMGEWDDLISIGKARRKLGYRPEHLWLDEYPEMAAHATRPGSDAP